MDPIQKLARRIRGVEKLAFRAATQPQLAHSSIEDGAIQSMEDGSLKAVIGKQYDGTQAIVVVNGPTPPTPTAPTGDPALEGAKLRWDGLFADGSVSPMDFSRVELHVSTDSGFTAEFADTLKATFETPRGGEVFIALPGGVEHYARLVARSLTGARSAASAVFAVTPQSIADSLPAPTDGDTPASSPAAAVGGGIGSLFLSWVPVVNADPVTYEVHASDTAGFTPGPTTLLTETPATQYVVRHLPGSTDPVPHTAPTYVRLVAKDPDGAAAPGAESSGTAILIETVDIADGAITPVKIPDDAITAAKIAAGAVGTTEIALDAITNDLIAANAVTGTEIANDSISTPKLTAGAVTAAKIAADTITANELAAGAVTASEIAAGAVTTAKLAADAVTANEIAANAVTASEIATDAVTAGKILAGAVTAEKVAAAAITAEKIAAGAIVTDKLAANAVSADKLAATIVLATQIMTGPSDQNRVLLDATGIQVLKADNSQRAVLPTDPASPVFIKGTAELDQVVINDKMTIRGTNNAISPGSNIQFQGSVKDPQSQISATIDWETVQTWMDPTQYSYAIRGLDFDSGGYHFANLFFGTQILGYNEAGAFAGNVGLPDLPAGVGSNYSGTYQAYGGIVKVGGYYFTLGTVHRISDNKNVWQVRKWTIDFIGTAYTFVGYADIGVDTVDFNGSGTYPILGKGLTTGLSLAWWAGVSGGYKLHMQNIDTSTCALLTSGGADYGPVIAAGNIGDLIYFEQGNFDFGAARTLFAHKQGGGQVVRSFSGTSQIVEDTFELPAGTVGVCYNPTSTNSFRSLQTSGSHAFNVKHTLINWITGGDSTTAVWWGTFTYRNTSSGYETGQSLYKSFTMGKRKRLTMTTPAIPPGGTANDPNAVRMWVGANPTQPARTAMWTFAAPAAGVITATQNTQVFGSPNTNPPATNTFPASAVSKLVDSSGNALVNSDGDAVLRDVLLRGLSSSASDANGPLVKVNTDGSGRMGQITWTAARAAWIDTDWVYPTLGSGWINAGGTWELTGYCRRGGIVYLKGVMINGTNGAAPFFLPAGMRPLNSKGFINVNTGSGGGRTQIRSDGAVYIDSGSGTAGWFLSNISFPAEQ